MRHKFYLLTTICLLALITSAMAQKSDSCNAGFSYAISQANGKAVTFVATDSGQANTVISTWNFGDGSTSHGVNVSHTYAAWGTYTVTHIVVDSATRCMDSTSQTIKLDSASSCFPGGVSFNYAKDSSAKSLTYTFTPVPNSSADHYYWSFGDGTTSTQRTPTHTFNTDSIVFFRTISLTVATSGKDSCSASTAQVIQLGGPIKDSTPTCTLASLATIVDSTYKNKPGYFQFYAYPQNPSYKYLWNFGDSTTSTKMDPAHQFAVANKSYNVTLYIVAPPTKPGQDSCTGFAQTITTNPGGPNDSTGNDSTGSRCALGTLSFSYSSDSTKPRVIHFLPAPDSSGYHYYWSFGDGTTSTQAAPTHTYAAGAASFTVNLVATQSGPDSCQGSTQNTIYFKSDSVGNDSTRCNLANASFSYTIDSTNKLKVHFLPQPDSASDHYYWNFGDGTTSTQAAPSHIYASRGGYTVNLVITTTGPDSCQATILNPVYVGNDSTGSDSTHPACSLDSASFSSYTDSTNQLAVHFIPQPNSSTYNYYWSFGDGSTSRQITPTHVYAHAGTYQVGVNITTTPKPGTTDSCQSYAQQAVTVDSSISRPGCSISFTYSFDSSNAKAVFFQAHPVPDSANNVIWYISKGADSSTRVTLNGMDPTYTFPDTGVYTVQIEASQPNGCFAQAESQILISGKTWNSTPNDSVPRLQSYPNPATDFVNLKVTLKTSGPISITIFSAMGAQVGVLQTSGTSGDNQVSIPVKNLPQGIYFMHIQTGNTSSQSRFQKQ